MEPIENLVNKYYFQIEKWSGDLYFLLVKLFYERKSAYNCNKC